MAFNQPFPVASPLMQKPPPPPSYGPDLAVRLICPECREATPDIREEFGSGDLVCGACGLVLGDRIIDTRSEWRTFANDEGDDPSRVGAATDPLLEGIEQLDTVISFRDGGSGVARELQRAATRAQGSRSERNILTAFRDISTRCDQFALPKTISDIAKQLYKRVHDEGVLKGKPQEAITAACIFIACRQAHVPRTFREFCDLTHVSKKLLGFCCRTISLTFNLAPGASTNPSAGPENILPRYFNQLDLPTYVQSICHDIIVEARNHGIADGRSPVSIAGGAIYFTCHLLGKPKSLREISSAASVSEGTIKLVYKLYYDAKEKLVKEKWIQEGKARLDRLPFDGK
ncbi:transcription factor TFIIB repeat-domain-containing protein [Schizophyllum commune]|nr:TFIIB-domain-containing protein [Schizophyllum commune H4-8]KAI5832162.1 TFIIB-domain-containing protein [Schizophyllum commune Tattone D]KAI5900542.1 TFIIB-domain-containing protein [Schizophyllum commune H4-8]